LIAKLIEQATILPGVDFFFMPDACERGLSTTARQRAMNSRRLSWFRT